MAELHTNKDLVISLDIKDYFPSIRVQHITELLQAYGCGPQAARTIAELLTYKYFLPQGALTSPKVSNLISSHSFGPEVQEFAQENDATLTLYADDLTLSLNWEALPERFRQESEDSRAKNLDVYGRQLIQRITPLVEQYPYRINRAKSKVMPYSERQWVCGVVVNEKTNLKYDSRKRLRAIVHNVETQGVDSQAQRMGVTRQEFIDSMRGRLNWFSTVNSELGRPLLSRFTSAVTSEQGDDEDSHPTSETPETTE